MELKAWDSATDRHYGYKDLSDLQLAWMDWVRSGASSEQADMPVLAAKPGSPPPYSRQASVLAVAGSENSDQRFVSPDPPRGRVAPNGPAESVADLPVNQGWYAKQMKKNRSSRRVAASRHSIDLLGSDAAGEEFPDQVVLPPNPSKTIWR
jgi:hypothetical protein